MESAVTIGGKLIGQGHPTFIIAEIGINHNGSIEIAKQLIDAAAAAGCDAVKFQKRTVGVVYSTEELERPRESIFGSTNGDLKNGLEFDYKDFVQIDSYCKKRGVLWFASCWDEASVDFIDQFAPPCYKIASASITDDGLLRHTAQKGRPIILSTGMSTVPMIEHAVEVIRPHLHADHLVLLHCTSFYPQNTRDPGEHGRNFINLRSMEKLRQKFHVPVGFSSHDTGIQPTYAACVLGACVVEKHITMYRGMWGSDQAASIEPDDLRRLCQMIRELEEVLGDGEKHFYEEERAVAQKLRRKWGRWNPEDFAPNQ